MPMKQFTPHLWVVTTQGQEDHRRQTHPDPSSSQPMSSGLGLDKSFPSKLKHFAERVPLDTAGPLNPKLFPQSADTAIDSCPMAPQGTPGPTGPKEDPAILIGLSLWTARQHERYLARTHGLDDGGVLHSYPAVLVDALRRHADAGDPNCRLVLDWLSRKGMLETDGQGASHKGGV